MMVLANVFLLTATQFMGAVGCIGVSEETHEVVESEEVWIWASVSIVQTSATDVGFKCT
jgi:hypothetical protein